ncbi:hypothetical protein CJP16_11345 [Aeromonas sobria]|uniref:Uncharacterized protein n=1 Tax=Aeromonas sobria TaxID=646 RepID=A0A2N3IY86_AERSO|nr:hypothetical protein [Aeromonas sobria]PKQ77763.1 hypothetical protein CJP16_11345 [Aeromonas sobria]
MRPYIVILAAAISFSASALQIGDFFQNAEVIKANSVKVVNDALIKVNTTIKGYAANAPYAIKTVDVPKASFMSHVKTNMKGLVKRNAWYAAWLGTMAAAGWAIDELTGQMKRKVVSSGTCGYIPGGNFSGITQSDCLQKVQSDWAAWDIFDMVGPVLSQTSTSKVFTYTFSAYPKSCSSPPCNQPAYKRDVKFYYSHPINAPTVDQPVPDDALFESLITEMLKDPKAAAQAFMVPDAWPYPYPHIFPDPVKYIPGVSETDEALLDALIKGQLQTTNPGAANYVTPEKYQQLQTLLSQLQQGITPDGQAGIANDNLKQPITQAQLEETLKKQKEAEAKADQEAATSAQAALAPAEATLDKLGEEKKWFEEAIKDSVNQAPPSQGISLPKWTWPVGNCRPFPITFSISKLSAKANDGGAFCDNYNDIYHPLIYWFLYMLLALYLFVLWNRTMVQVLGSR